jgi:hypothetical protein
MLWNFKINLNLLTLQVYLAMQVDLMMIDIKLVVTLELVDARTSRRWASSSGGGGQLSYHHVLHVNIIFLLLLVLASHRYRSYNNPCQNWYKILLKSFTVFISGIVLRKRKQYNSIFVFFIEKLFPFVLSH